MRAILCESWRDFDALEVKDIAPPPMRPGGVRIAVEAAGLSFATQLVVAGAYQRKPPLPFVPGTEVVGRVLEGPIAAGTRVFAVLDWGGFAEQAVADAIHCIPVPEHLPHEAAVAFPISYPTAGGALLWRAKPAPGEWVLVHGAAGGVGLAGVEIARAIGCRVLARAGAAKHGLLRAPRRCGLDSALPFREAERAATGGARIMLRAGAGRGVVTARQRGHRHPAKDRHPLYVRNGKPGPSRRVWVPHCPVSTASPPAAAPCWWSGGWWIWTAACPRSWTKGAQTMPSRIPRACSRPRPLRAVGAAPRPVDGG